MGNWRVDVGFTSGALLILSLEAFSYGLWWIGTPAIAGSAGFYVWAHRGRP